MKNGFLELCEKLIVFLLIVGTYVALIITSISRWIADSVLWFLCQFASEWQLAKDDSGMFDKKQPRCPSGRHERYRL